MRGLIEAESWVNSSVPFDARKYGVSLIPLDCISLEKIPALFMLLRLGAC